VTHGAPPRSGRPWTVLTATGREPNLNTVHLTTVQVRADEGTP
jgi:pyruvate/2-oxoglutarate dehydrogenase complex dihydrolipoamide dehydrogenase (E3) component